MSAPQPLQLGTYVLQPPLAVLPATSLRDPSVARLPRPGPPPQLQLGQLCRRPRFRLPHMLREPALLPQSPALLLVALPRPCKRRPKRLRWLGALPQLCRRPPFRLPRMLREPALLPQSPALARRLTQPPRALLLGHVALPRPCKRRPKRLRGLGALPQLCRRPPFRLPRMLREPALLPQSPALLLVALPRPCKWRPKRLRGLGALPQLCKRPPFRLPRMLREPALLPRPLADRRSNRQLSSPLLLGQDDSPRPASRLAAAACAAAAAQLPSAAHLPSQPSQPRPTRTSPGAAGRAERAA